MNFLELPERVKGKRKYGLTSIMDLGIPSRELENFLYEYGEFIDIAKFGIGTAYIAPNIKHKIALYKKYDIEPYFGGTFFEKCYYQGKMPQFINTLSELGIEWIEVSTGTVDIPLQERLDIVSELKGDFRIIAEVGSKDTSREMSISNWKSEISLLLDRGCEYVITEGRGSGTAGIYNQNGQVDMELIDQLLQDLDEKKVIFEAPTPKHQMYFINKVGPNVNLGNVKLEEVLILETQRHGLRCETFFMDGQKCKLH
jgi:phosphosulfolactate synthase